MSAVMPDPPQSTEPRPVEPGELHAELLIPHEFVETDAPDGQDRAAAAPAPQVVVVYRDRIRWGTLLLTPALLGMIAALLLFRGQDDRRGWAGRPAPSIAASAAPAPESIAPVPAVTLKVQSLPVETRLESALPFGAAETPRPVTGEDSAETVHPDSAVLVANLPDLAATPAPDDLAPPPPTSEPPAAIGFDPPDAAAADQVEPPMDPQEATAIALAQIQQRAQQMRADRLEQEALRNDPVIIERQRARTADLAQAQAIARLQAEYSGRVAFHDTIRDLLRSPTAAEQIHAQVSQFVHASSPIIQQALAKALNLRGPAYYLQTSRRIAILRANRISEPMILGDLIAQELATRSGRDGARNSSQAIVRAARQLLSVPPPEPRPETAAAAAAPDRPDNRQGVAR